MHTWEPKTLYPIHSVESKSWKRAFCVVNRNKKNVWSPVCEFKHWLKTITPSHFSSSQCLDTHSLRVQHIEFYRPLRECHHATAYPLATNTPHSEESLITPKPWNGFCLVLAWRKTLLILVWVRPHKLGVGEQEFFCGENSVSICQCRYGFTPMPAVALCSGSVMFALHCHLCQTDAWGKASHSWLSSTPPSVWPFLTGILSIISLINDR